MHNLKNILHWVKRLSVIATVVMSLASGRAIAIDRLNAPTKPEVGTVDLGSGEVLVGSFSVFAKVVMLKGNVDQLPTFLQQPMPDYASDVLNAGVPGRVVVLFVIDKQGHVESATVEESTNPAFARDSKEAVARWRFSPPHFKGEPIPINAKAVFIFSIFQMDPDVVLAPEARHK